MDRSQKISVCSIPWDAFAHNHLNGVGGLPADTYRKMKETDAVIFYAVLEGLKRVATVVLRFEQHMHGHIEAVLVAAGGLAKQDLTLLALPMFERIAKARGAHSFRLHTERPGLIRKLACRAGDNELSVRWELA